MFGFFVKDKVSKCVLFFWIFNSIPLLNVSVSVSMSCSIYHYCSIVKLEVRDGDSSSCSFIGKNCFRYSESFAFLDEFENCSLHDFEELC